MFKCILWINCTLLTVSKPQWNLMPRVHSFSKIMYSYLCIKTLVFLPMACMKVSIVAFCYRFSLVDFLNTGMLRRKWLMLKTNFCLIWRNLKQNLMRGIGHWMSLISIWCLVVSLTALLYNGYPGQGLNCLYSLLIQLLVW